MTMANSPVHWPSCTWCWTWRNHSWHTNFKSALFCHQSSAHSSDVKISCHFADSEPQRCFWLHPIWVNRAAPTASFERELSNFYSIFVGLYEAGQVALIDAKANFRFGNKVPTQWTLSGFLQHTSAKSMYKNYNKNSQQLKLETWKCLFDKNKYKHGTGWQNNT